MERCLDDSQRLAAADPQRPLPPGWVAHLQRCPRCRDEVDALQDLAALLAGLGRAERAAANESPAAWTRVAHTVSRPALRHRLPMPFAGVWRLGADLVRPALAGSLVALACGLAAGTLLAVASDRDAATATATAASFEASGLDATAPGGIESDYFAAVDDAAAGASAEAQGDTSAEGTTP